MLKVLVVDDEEACLQYDLPHDFFAKEKVINGLISGAVKGRGYPGSFLLECIAKTTRKN